MSGSLSKVGSLVVATATPTSQVPPLLGTHRALHCGSPLGSQEGSGATQSC